MSTIRNAEINDLDALTEIENECSGMPWTYDQMEEEILFRFARTYVCEEEGAVVGFLSAHVLEDEGHINEFGVKAGSRNRGHGQALLSAFLEDCADTGVKKITLEVREGAASAIRLYEKNGWKRVGFRRDFYRNPTEDGIVMMLQLGTDLC